MDHKASSESEITLDGGHSPEFLPPRAKIQRLTGKKTSLTVEPGKPLHIQELQSSQMEATFSKEIPAAERLKLIKEQEERIECLLVTLETSVKKGQSVKIGINMIINYEVPRMGTLVPEVLFFFFSNETAP